MNTLTHAYDRLRGSCQRISLSILEIGNPVAVVSLATMTLLVSLSREKVFQYRREIIPADFLRNSPLQECNCKSTNMSSRCQPMRSRVSKLWHVQSEGTKTTTDLLVLFRRAFNQRARGPLLIYLLCRVSRSARWRRGCVSWSAEGGAKIPEGSG